MKRSDFNKIYAEYLKSDEWMAKRKQVLKRDNHTCTACLEATATQVHHTTYERVFDEPLFHLQSVCDDCHAKIHDKRTDIERAKRFMPSGMSVTTNSRGRKQVVVQDLKIELTEEESLGWKTGDKIYTRSFGNGHIKRIAKLNGDLFLDILFDNGQMGRFLPKYTPLARTKEEFDAEFDTADLMKLVEELRVRVK